MTEDEQRFWDAAFVAYVAGLISDPACYEVNIPATAKMIDKMLEERRKRTGKTSASA